MITLNHFSILYHKFSWTKKRLFCSCAWRLAPRRSYLWYLFYLSPATPILGQSQIRGYQQKWHRHAVYQLSCISWIPGYPVQPVPGIFLKESWSAPEKRKYQISKFPFREINGYKHHNYIECHRTEARGVFSLAPIPAVLRLGLGWREAKNSYLILEDLPMNGMVRVRWHCISSQHTSPHPCTRGELCAVWEE